MMFVAFSGPVSHGHASRQCHCYDNGCFLAVVDCMEHEWPLCCAAPCRRMTWRQPCIVRGLMDIHSSKRYAVVTGCPHCSHHGTCTMPTLLCTRPAASGSAHVGSLGDVHMRISRNGTALHCVMHVAPPTDSLVRSVNKGMRPQAAWTASELEWPRRRPVRHCIHYVVKAVHVGANHAQCLRCLTGALDADSGRGRL